MALRADRAQAEDLVQEAWIRLYGKGWARPSRAAFFKTIRNLFIDQYRRESLVAFEPMPDDADELAAVAVFNDDVIVDGVGQALDTLRPAEREALFLHVVEGYTIDELARLLSHPRGSVLSLIHRAKMKLRDRLTQSTGGTRASQTQRTSHG
jgi:RNA polymerase sigma-70 factor (ECF subfamily)